MWVLLVIVLAALVSVGGIVAMGKLSEFPVR